MFTCHVIDGSTIIASRLCRNEAEVDAFYSAYDELGYFNAFDFKCIQH